MLMIELGQCDQYKTRTNTQKEGLIKQAIGCH